MKISSIHTLFALLITGICVSPLQAKSIRISLLLHYGQLGAFEETFAQFTSETGISITPVIKNNEAYKKTLPVWLRESKETPDVLYWMASQRLYKYVKQDVIHPITRLWKQDKLDRSFSHVKSSVTYKGEIYALPLSYYAWGMFYRKSLVKKYGGTPKTWEELISLCTKMKQAGITPFGVGGKQKWPVTAWFDYINLRINGLSFHQRLLSGEISFQDERVRQVLIKWKQLIDLQFFNKDRDQLKWEDTLPFLYRNKTGFILIGNFSTSEFPVELVEDIGMMSFPKIKDIPRYEEAPLDIFMIARHSKHLKEAETFIRFMARADIQSQMNDALGFLPPNINARVSRNAFSQAGAEQLRTAKGTSQYFDRDTLPAFEQKAVPLLAEFMTTGNIDQTLKKLERFRRAVYQRGTGGSF